MCRSERSMITEPCHGLTSAVHFCPSHLLRPRCHGLRPLPSALPRGSCVPDLAEHPARPAHRVLIGAAQHSFFFFFSFGLYLGGSAMCHPSRASGHAPRRTHAYWKADWCLQSDCMPNTRLQAHSSHFASQGSGRSLWRLAGLVYIPSLDGVDKGYRGGIFATRPPPPKMGLCAHRWFSSCCRCR